MAAVEDELARRRAVGDGGDEEPAETGEDGVRTGAEPLGEGADESADGNGDGAPEAEAEPETVDPIRARKAEDYAIWREAVEVWLSEVRKGGGAASYAVGNRLAWEKLDAIRQRLVEVRKYRVAEVSP